MIINRENSSDESEVSDSSTNAKTSFRVSVCLRRYFKDHRARCYMQVTRNRRVRWLEKRINKVFSLPQMFCLCSNGHLLPSTEPLALLDPGDSIEVIPLKESKESNMNMKNGCLNSTMVISDSTQPILTENSTPFSCEIAKNKALFNDNESIHQICESIVEKNNTNLNKSSKNIELISHIMETNQSESTASFDNQKDIDKQTMYDEADGATKTLQHVKQQALKLFESECGVTAYEPKRRVRRRVRRRIRRAASPTLPAAPLPAAPLLLPSVASSPRPPHLRFSSPPPCSQTLFPIPEPRSSSPLEVARNEEVSVRLPRVIRPLGVDQ